LAPQELLLKNPFLGVRVFFGVRWIIRVDTLDPPELFNAHGLLRTIHRDRYGAGGHVQVREAMCRCGGHVVR